MIETKLLDVKDFNPRPRKEGDDKRHAEDFVAALFQSTPSQRGRRDTTKRERMIKDISIHALAKRATGWSAAD